MADKRADRASQFIPFDALKGFREALRQKEKEVEKKQDMLYISEGCCNGNPPESKS